MRVLERVVAAVRMGFSQRKRASSLLILLALAPLSALASDTLAKIKQTGTVVIGYRDDSFPFSYLDGDRPIGYSIDLCMKVVDAIRKDLKRPDIAVKFSRITSATRISALKTGEVDIECESATNTAERRKEVAFTIPTFYALTRMLARNDGKVQTHFDLRGRTVVTTQSTTPEKLLKERKESYGATIVLGKSHQESFDMVVSGKADAFVMDDVLLFAMRAASAEPEKLAITGNPLSVEPLALMLRKDDPAFKKLVDTEIARVITQNEIGAIYRKWFESPIPPKQVNLKLPMSYVLKDSFKAPSDWVPN